MQRMNVVLPEPDGPMMQTVSRLRPQRDALQHLQAAEPLVDVDRADDDVEQPAQSWPRNVAPRSRSPKVGIPSSRSLTASRRSIAPG